MGSMERGQGEGGGRCGGEVPCLVGGIEALLRIARAGRGF